MTYDDPDGNGIDDTFAIALNIPYAHHFIDDIYKSYGCYFNKNGSAISYNPNIQKFQNSAYSENIEECLTFLKNLNDEKLVNLIRGYNPEYPLNVVASKSIGSFRHNKLSDIYTGNGKWLIIGKDIIQGSNYLRGINQDNLYETQYSPKMYGILKDSEEIQSLVDFITKANSSESLGPSLMYGILGDDYFLASENENVIVVNNENIQTGMIVDLRNMGKYTITVDVYEEIRTNITNDKLYPYNGDRIIENPYQYTVPIYAAIGCYEDSFPKNYLDRINFNELVIRNLLEQNVSVDNILDEYKKLCNMLDVDSYLDKLNEKLNLN